MANVVKAGTNVMQPAAILALIGGGLMILGGIAALAAFSVWYPQMMAMPWGDGMMGGRMWGGWNTMPGGFMWWPMATVSSIAIGSGVVTVLGGYKLYIRKASSNVTGWSTAILVASIVGLVSMSGFFVGPVLGIIGGILALTKRGQ